MTPGLRTPSGQKAGRRRLSKRGPSELRRLLYKRRREGVHGSVTRVERCTTTPA
ncbi:MAG: transposase [Methyloglobulus sp.]|nr:transposase [Methyloglobulus sp.]